MRSIPTPAFVILVMSSGALSVVDCAVPWEHQGVGAKVTGEDCYGCHSNDYRDADNPRHMGRLVIQCADCHEETGWRPALFPDHPVPLVGAHERALCAGCHGDPPSYEGTPTECVQCHRDDYDRSPYPGHDTFPTNCESCHSLEAWAPALETGEHALFPLEGAHGRAACSSCHGEPPVYGGQPHECVGCHQDDYDGATFAGHEAFPTACANCHSVEAWIPANFDHDDFPIDGAHEEVRCAGCHGEPPTYEGTPSDCVGCHRADYDASPYPGHGDFSTNCTDCHTTDGWVPASGGSHPEGAFPITRGAHSEIECAECHDRNLSASYSQNVNCIGCHTRGEVDNDHDEVGRYQFDESDPDFCRECHSSGRED